MAFVDNARVTREQLPGPPQQGHQRSKSNVFKSFMHRRTNSDGVALPPADLTAPVLPQVLSRPSADDMRSRDVSRRPVALGEIQNTRVSPPGSISLTGQPGTRSRSRSPIKTFGLMSLKVPGDDGRSSVRESKRPESSSDYNSKKTKSATNLVGLLTRPRSSKNLKADGEDDARPRAGKENMTPPDSLGTTQDETRPPIYAQFSSGTLEKPSGSLDVFGREGPPTSNRSSSGAFNTPTKPRPKSYHAQYTQPPEVKSGHNSVKSPRGLKVFTRGLMASKPEPSPAEKSEPTINPQDIDKHLEAMLDRRNIPENQRYKMRNLADTIKMEFIRQDWAENNMNRTNTMNSDTSASEMDKGSIKPKKSRGNPFTLSRNGGKKSEPNSPNKKKGEGTLGRHFRSRSTDSIASERPSSSGSGSGGGILSKIKMQQSPADFVTYLRKVRKPELVEVGKLHKLRLLLRNETVAWTDDFVRQGGMEEIVGLLHRIMEVEWREEHEDALLHENLLCLKALCTTGLALQYLHSIQATLFPALLHLIFDPEKKGPSEFTTRNIITSVLFTYIQSASPQDRVIRARTVLNHLRDPEPKEDERPLEFVLEMRRERPYRVWCKETVSVTKEVFWIFLHHLNVVALPRDYKDHPVPSAAALSPDSLDYLHAHFPHERAPVPAAPYVGGVEWDATNYLASHLDLLNAIIACTPSLEERNKLRAHLRISGWERCMGGSMRLCKEKFYPGVHDALRTWVAAAYEDGWEIKDVRYGPPAEPKSPAKNGPGGANKAKAKKTEETPPPPKLDIPKLDFTLGPSSPGAKPSTDWLS